jgi:hypothetical protein
MEDTTTTEQGDGFEAVGEDGWQDAGITDVDPLSPFNPDFRQNLSDSFRESIADAIAPLADRMQPGPPAPEPEPEWTAEDMAQAHQEIGAEFDRLTDELGQFDHEIAAAEAQRVFEQLVYEKGEQTKEIALEAIQRGAETARGLRHGRDLLEQFATLEQRRYHEKIDPKQLQELATEKLRRELEAGGDQQQAAVRAVEQAAAELGGRRRYLAVGETAAFFSQRARILEEQSRGFKRTPVFEPRPNEFIEVDGKKILNGRGTVRKYAEILSRGSART